jgi:hypothetical protein
LSFVTEGLRVDASTIEFICTTREFLKVSSGNSSTLSLYSSTLQSCSQVDLNEGVPDLVVDPICCGDDGPGQGCGVSSSKQKLQVVAYAGCTMVDSGQWTLLLKGNTSPKSSIRLH